MLYILSWHFAIKRIPRLRGLKLFEVPDTEAEEEIAIKRIPRLRGLKLYDSDVRDIDDCAIKRIPRLRGLKL